ncbi:hypothetical protein VNO78_24962 [Psophocarpus tetragonolobus]|uniref:MADS-box domain-containing protein n=1 Tax=Psophocarpus tetragonolobus TaxID=3891 RepID=A0AAN9XFD8_PSOTE
MASSATKGSRKRRRSTQIKEVVQVNRRHVTFSKRKLGLFNKLSELSLLCQVETALIITSQNGKLYSCGYPNADAVIRRYLDGGQPQPVDRKQQEAVETLRLEYEASQKQLKEAQKRFEEVKETHKDNANLWLSSWWNLPIESMGLENLEEFRTSLEALKINLVGAHQEKRYLLNSVPPMPSINIIPSTPMVTPIPPPQFPNMSISHFTHCWNTPPTSTTAASTFSAGRY